VGGSDSSRLFRFNREGTPGSVFPFLQARRINKEDSMLKYALSAAGLLAFAAPALAADTFYVVQDKEKKTCTVVKEKPTTTNMVVVDENGMTFTTEEEAEAAMKKTKVCVSQ
jgi:hypothetical protein